MGLAQGAQMAFGVANIRDRRIQQAWLRKLQEQQMQHSDITFQEGREDRRKRDEFGNVVSNAISQPKFDPMELAKTIAPYAPGQAINLATATPPDTPENKLLRQMFLEKYKAGLRPEPDPQMTEGALMDRALKGDPQAQAILDATFKRKMKLAAESGISRYKALGETRGVPVIDTKTGDAVYKTWSQINTDAKKGIQYQAAGYTPELKSRLARAAQAGGARAASITTAFDTFQQEGPSILALREKVQKKNLLPTGGLKDLESVNQWVGKRTSDPDVAELQKKVKLLADLLQRTFGTSQGGEWSFEIAADILDPSYSSKAFNRIWNSHEKTMFRMSKAYENFGKSILPQNKQYEMGDGTQNKPRFKILKVE
jgi:hypothetical protein